MAQIEESGSEYFDTEISVQTRKWKRCVAVNRPQKGISFYTNLAVVNRSLVPQWWMISNLGKTAQQQHPSLAAIRLNHSPPCWMQRHHFSHESEATRVETS